MSSLTLTRRLPSTRYRESRPCDADADFGVYGRMKDAAVVVEADAIVLDPGQMSIGRYYLAVINDTPYVYRRISDKEIEVYGVVGEA